MRLSNKFKAFLILVYVIIFIISIGTKFQNYIFLASMVYFIIFITRSSKVKIWEKLLPNIIGGVIAGSLMIIATSDKTIGINSNTVITSMFYITGLTMIYFLYYGKSQIKIKKG